MKNMTPHHFGELQFQRNAWLVELQPGETIDDLKRPEFMAHVAKSLKPRDRLEVWSHDNTSFAEAIVVNAGGNWAKLHILAIHDLAPKADAIDAPEGYEIKFAGRAKWRIVRLSDKQVIKDQFGSQEEASAWLSTNMVAA